MRLLVVAAALAALCLPAFAQQQRPPQQQQQRQPAPPPQQQAKPQEAPAPAPGMFACRTEAETCFIAIVTSPNQVSVLYSNDPAAEGVEQQVIAVQLSPGSQADLGQHAGRVVMLTGRYSAQGGLSGAELIDVASPLLSFAIKSMLAGEGEIEEEEEEPPPPPKPQPRQPQQQRR